MTDVVATDIAAKIKVLAKARAAHAKAEEKAAALKEQRSAIEADLIAAMWAAKLDVAASGDHRVAIIKTREPQVEDWEAFYAYIKKHNAFELLHKRVSAPAWRERTEKAPLPGVVNYINVKLSFRKA